MSKRLNVVQSTQSDYSKDENERQDRSTRRLCAIRMRQRQKGRSQASEPFHTSMKEEEEGRREDHRVS